MTALFGLLRTGASGMKAHSYSLNLSANNVANASTPGYVRRSTVLQEQWPPPPISGGVQVTGTRRHVDPYLEKRMLSAESMKGRAEAGVGGLGILDNVFAEGPGQLGEAIAHFETALSSLASQPNDGGVRSDVLGRAEQLAQAFRNTADSVAQARDDLNQRVVETVGDVNLRLEQIGDLNIRIANIEGTGGDASSMRDQREQLVREVAERVPVSALENQRGGINLVLTGGGTLVTAEGSVAVLGLDNDASGDTTVTFTEAGGKVEVTDRLTSGSIGGYLAARDGALADARDGLDSLAHDIATAYNDVHSAGFDLDGNTGSNLFAPSATAAGAAITMRVSDDVKGNPDAVAAATDAAQVPGDNRNALALQALSSASIAGGGSATASGAMASMTGSAGRSISSFKDDGNYADAVHQQLTEMREAVSGVSMDEEMTKITFYQRAYEASIQVLKTADQMLAELINMRR